MSALEGAPLRDISDTARWMAVFRAVESERPDAHFRDPFARALAGDRGERIAGAIPFGQDAAWSFVARTWLFDTFIEEEIQRGADMVVNLAAGVDARPYRMPLPPALQWIEIDLPGILDYKERILAAATPVCRLERIRLDLADVAARRATFAALAARARRALVLTEGLIIYLDAAQVGALAADLAAVPPFERWVTDLASPALLRLLEGTMGKVVGDAGAPFRFAPDDGPDFFRAWGWRPIDVRTMIKAAARLKRLPWKLRPFALLPDSKGRGNRPWSGVVMLENARVSPAAGQP